MLLIWCGSVAGTRARRGAPIGGFATIYVERYRRRGGGWARRELHLHHNCLRPARHHGDVGPHRQPRLPLASAVPRARAARVQRRLQLEHAQGGGDFFPPDQCAQRTTFFGGGVAGSRRRSRGSCAHTPRSRPMCMLRPRSILRARVCRLRPCNSSRSSTSKSSSGRSSRRTFGLGVAPRTTRRLPPAHPYNHHPYPITLTLTLPLPLT